MAVEELLSCEWPGRSRRDHRVVNPSWEEVKSAIERLDNDLWNDVYLHPRLADPETYLCIGGGAGSYIVSASVRNEQFFTVADPTVAGSSKLPLVVGGQQGLYPANQVITLRLALKAVRSYFDLGGPGGTVLWVNNT